MCHHAGAKPNEKNLTKRFYYPYKIVTPSKKPKFKPGQIVRIRRKFELFHRGYRTHFIQKVFQIPSVETLNPPTYSLRDSNHQLTQGKFYESELVQFEEDNEQSTNISLTNGRLSQRQTFAINLVSDASMSTFPDSRLAKFTTLLPQSLILHGNWEVTLLQLSWPGFIENVKGLFSYQQDRKEENRDKSTQKNY